MSMISAKLLLIKLINFCAGNFYAKVLLSTLWASTIIFFAPEFFANFSWCLDYFLHFFYKTSLEMDCEILYKKVLGFNKANQLLEYQTKLLAKPQADDVILYTSLMNDPEANKLVEEQFLRLC